jgi:hypothetical protein
MIQQVSSPQVVVKFDADFLKKTAHDVIDNVVDKTAEVSSQFLKEGAEKAIPLAADYVAGCAKETIGSQVPVLVKPLTDLAVNASEEKGKDYSKQKAPAAIDGCVKATSNVSKSALKSGVNQSIDTCKGCI